MKYRQPIAFLPILLLVITGCSGPDTSNPTPSVTDSGVDADVGGDVGIDMTDTIETTDTRDTSDAPDVRPNRPPVAEAGSDLEGEVGTAVQLDGSGSHDPDGDVLTYQWAFVSTPEANSAEIVDAASEQAEFTPDAEGMYVVELTVADEKAAASDRLTVDVEPAEGGTTSTLYLAPDGEDTNPGTEESPLATLGAALDKAAGDDKISRFRLAPGTYDQGSTEHTISDDLEIVGPNQASDRPVIRGSDTLLAVESNAFVTLLDIEIESDGEALYVDGGAGVSLSRVGCRARLCVRAGSLFGGSGGRVVVTESTLQGTGDKQAGISGFGADEITVSETTIEGFSSGQGIQSVDTPVSIRDSTIRDNAQGMDLWVNSSQNATSIRNSQLTGNTIGLRNRGAKNVSLQQTTIDRSTQTGIVTEGGALQLDGVTVKTGDDKGIVIEDSNSQGAVVTLRDSKVLSHLGEGIVVEGEKSTLDLGSQATAGNNEVRFNKGTHLKDVRPDGATGLITLQETQLGSGTPPAGTYEGPSFNGWGMHIANSNEVVVY